MIFNPSKIPITIGKNDIKKTTIIFETIPAPNQTINIGAKANIGITCEAITYGKKDFSSF
ncbi:MAG: hypothetical protein Ct9H90mP2_03430 [Dehalococcoidia bacterium]|nr:MAG: hypothetical protein Ct9H90mP2_03430 [Dehalococcoidia bacterium]